ncbi:sodium/hydrogen exchanger 9B2 isoform X2 [Misgurnus anguillicaudatus]|uniref:sodium/hydrogen exchanger 9B2 isoform X2 n=1 Tax=Misgurnus anguillicaudatus TaxID=75329 RepID=UPI003CCFD5E0
MSEDRETQQTCHELSSKPSGLFVKLQRCPKPSSFTASVITRVVLGALLLGLVWAVTGPACAPGQNLFGLVVLFLSAVCGGKLISVFTFPNTPPVPALLGMLLAGVVLRNVPYVTDSVYIDQNWSSALRNVALAVILTRAGLGINGSALHHLKAVCVRVAVGPCVVEACTVAVVGHFLLELPWIWSFLLGFVLAAVSPAVVVPSMLLLQTQGYGVQKGIPTLLMAAGSFDDILAITGFTTCLGIAFGTGSTWMNIGKGVLEVVGGILAGGILGILLYFIPSTNQADVVLLRSCLLMGLSVFSVFAGHAVGLAGAGGLCTLVLAFISGLGWAEQKAPVAAVVSRFWDVCQPLLFGLIGAEINISSLSAYTEKIFISLAWMPKATVQAAIGSMALDTAHSTGDEQLQYYGMEVLTVAVLAILITAPMGALIIGFTGPKLLQKYTTTHQHINTQDQRVKTCDLGSLESKL